MNVNAIFKWLVLFLLVVIVALLVYLAVNLDDLIEEVYSINQRIGIIVNELSN